VLLIPAVKWMNGCYLIKGSRIEKFRVYKL
jgi:hypothetical protein